MNFYDYSDYDLSTIDFVTAPEIFSSSPPQFRAAPIADMTWRANTNNLDIFIPPVNNTIKVPSLPGYLSGAHFYCGQSQVSLIAGAVDNVLTSLEPHCDFYFKSMEAMWQCKYSNGSLLYEANVSLYWDPLRNDHVLEIMRVSSGEYYGPSQHNLLHLLEYAITGKASPSKRLSPSPLPLRSSVDANCKINEELFFSGLCTILSWTTSGYYESQIEAAKTLFDLVDKSSEYLGMPKCVEKIIDSVSSLMKSENATVQEITVSVIDRLVSIPTYAMSMSNQTATLCKLTSFVDNCRDECLRFQCAQMRRKAAQVLSIVASVSPSSMILVLSHMGYSSKMHWQTHVNSLRDERCRSFASLVSNSFNSLAEVKLTASASDFSAIFA